MPTIWTEEQKAAMQRLKYELGWSNADIGAKFNTSGDNIRKVLARMDAKVKQPATAEAAPGPFGIELGPRPRPPDNPVERGVKTRQERLAEHELSAHRQYRVLSGRPPLRIMPKDFQK